MWSMYDNVLTRSPIGSYLMDAIKEKVIPGIALGQNTDNVKAFNEYFLDNNKSNAFFDSVSTQLNDCGK